MNQVQEQFVGLVWFLVVVISMLVVPAFYIVRAMNQSRAEYGTVIPSVVIGKVIFIIPLWILIVVMIVRVISVGTPIDIQKHVRNFYEQQLRPMSDKLINDKGW